MSEKLAVRQPDLKRLASANIELAHAAERIFSVSEELGDAQLKEQLHLAIGRIVDVTEQVTGFINNVAASK